MAEDKTEKESLVDEEKEEELVEPVSETSQDDSDNQNDNNDTNSADDISNNEDSVDEDSSESEVDIDPLQELQAKYDALEDKYLRANAEMQNMQTRFAKEQATSVKYANQELAKSILPALDNLERAIDVEVDGESAKQIKSGVEMVYKTLNSALEDNDIKSVGSVGDTFDPEVHQSVQTEPADDQHPADTIAKVLQKGYLLDDRVVRPAMVVVYN